MEKREQKIRRDIWQAAYIKIIGCTGVYGEPKLEEALDRPMARIRDMKTRIEQSLHSYEKQAN